MIKVPVEITARHLHISKHDLEILFGRNYKLKVLKSINQPGQFAAKETISLKGSKNVLNKVRIVGPIRKATQVEITLTDSYVLGIKVPYRKSGQLKNSGKLTLIGPRGEVNLKQGVIIPLRHLHLSPTEAINLKLKDKQKVSVKVGSERHVTFHNVIVRVHKDFKLSVHLDTDEANAAGLLTCTYGELIK